MGRTHMLCLFALLVIWVAAVTVQGQEYENLGCFKDKGEGERAINVKPIQFKKDVIKNCYKKAKAKNSRYFAIQNGGSCRFGKGKFGKYDKYGKSGKCKNGKGGGFANNVYKIKKDATTTAAPTTAAETTAAPTTAAETTAAPTTAAETTVAPTTEAETTAAPTTAAETTAAPTTVAETTAAPTTAPETTAAPTTAAETTAAPTTVAETTAAPTTAAETTSSPTTAAETTAAPTTVAETTAAPTTVAVTTVAPTTAAETTAAQSTSAVSTPASPTAAASTPAAPTPEGATPAVSSPGASTPAAPTPGGSGGSGSGIGVWGPWTDKGECNVPCGPWCCGAITRKCSTGSNCVLMNGGGKTGSVDNYFRVCKAESCPASESGSESGEEESGNGSGGGDGDGDGNESDGGTWGQWAPSGGCDKSCGRGSMPITRKCQTGSNCLIMDGNGKRGSVDNHIQVCNPDPCPRPTTRPRPRPQPQPQPKPAGKWGPWTDSGECDVSCNGGTMPITRKCLTGSNCILTNGNGKRGSVDNHKRVCNLKSCPTSGSDTSVSQPPLIKEQGYCKPVNGVYKIVKLDSLGGSSMERKLHCLKKCKRYEGMTGCEVVFSNTFKGCIVHKSLIARGNGHRNAVCWIKKAN